VAGSEKLEYCANPLLARNARITRQYFKIDFITLIFTIQADVSAIIDIKKGTENKSFPGFNKKAYQARLGGPRNEVRIGAAE
jgi:hypothetical protein